MVERREAAEPDLGSQFAAGDDDGVLEVVYAAHGALVYSYCRRMLEAGRAADATQEVFVGAWRSRGRYRPDAGKLAGWLIGLARVTVIDIQRADGLQPTLDPPPRDSRPVAGDATYIAKRMLVGEAMAALPERARRIVQLAIFEDLTHAQIAERCDLPLDTVKADIHRGVERMRRHLEGFEHAA